MEANWKQPDRSQPRPTPHLVHNFEHITNPLPAPILQKGMEFILVVTHRMDFSKSKSDKVYRVLSSDYMA